MIRYPYHRYLRYQVLNGDDVDTVREHMDDLQYIPPEEGDVQELVDDISGILVNADLRRRHDVLFFDDECESLDIMFWIVETGVVRTQAEKLLLDKVPVSSISKILGLKFNERVTTKAVEMFRAGFWDTATLSPVDFSEYFHLADERKPDPPPERVSLVHRPHYRSWEEGLPPDEETLTVDEMLREVTVDAFMQFKRLQSSANPEDQKQAMNYAGLLLKTAPARKAARFADGKKGDEIPALKPMIEYPEQDVPTLKELHRRYTEQTQGDEKDA